MKKKLSVLIVVTLIVLLQAGVVSASGALPGSGWWTQETVINISPDTANVTATAFSSSDSSTYSASSTLATGQSVTFDPSSFSGMPSGFIGSAVVSADKEILAIGTVTNRPDGTNGITGGKASARYQGMNAPASTLYFPVTKNNWWGLTSVIYLQNADTVADTFTATFRTGDGNTYEYTSPSVGPSQMIVITPADAGMPDGPSNNATRVNIGGLTVVSNGGHLWAGMYLDYRNTETIATNINGTRALTDADKSALAYVPSAKNYWYNRYSGIPVLNVDDHQITITIDYRVTSRLNGSCPNATYQDVRTADPGFAANFILYGTNTTLPGTSTNGGCVITATISANGNFIAITNENNVSGNAAGSAVYAVPSSSVTTKGAIPWFTDNWFGFTGGLQVMNVSGTDATNVVATFYCYGQGATRTPFTAITSPFTITAGSSFLFYRPSTNQPSKGLFRVDAPFLYTNSVCSAIITADQNIAMLINEVSLTDGAVDDTKYEGFNIIP